MKIWTLQPEQVYESLLLHNVIHCDPAKSEFLEEKNFELSYKWMAEQMKKRIGNPPKGVEYPIWAWHTWNSKHQKPDLRRMEFRGFNENMVCLELEIPDHKVLLSDEVMWHLIIYDSYIENHKEKDMDFENLWFDRLPKEQQKVVKEQSWVSIFDMSLLQDKINNDLENIYIQATFWELQLENVVNIRRFKGR